MADTESSNASAIELAADLVMAWLSNPNTRADAEDVPAFLKSMNGAINDLLGTNVVSESATPARLEFTPAVSIRKSLGSKDHIISMIDGKPYRTLRRHLSTRGLTPEEYRARYKLPTNYPMVAESYSEARRAMAKQIGLGRKPGEKPSTKPPVTAKTKASTPPGKRVSSAVAKKAPQKRLSGKA